MSVISANDQLNDAILKLQQKQSEEFLLLKEQLRETYGSLQPINLIKSTFHEIINDAEIQENIKDDFIGIATGYISKKMFVGEKPSPIKNILGVLLQFIITALVSKKFWKKKKRKKKPKPDLS